MYKLDNFIANLSDYMCPKYQPNYGCGCPACFMGRLCYTGFYKFSEESRNIHIFIINMYESDKIIEDKCKNAF